MTQDDDFVGRNGVTEVEYLRSIIQINAETIVELRKHILKLRSDIAEVAILANAKLRE